MAKHWNDILTNTDNENSKNDQFVTASPLLKRFNRFRPSLTTSTMISVTTETMARMVRMAARKKMPMMPPMAMKALMATLQENDVFLLQQTAEPRCVQDDQPFKDNDIKYPLQNDLIYKVKRNSITYITKRQTS